ncbi:hypothetical protein HMN09_00465300 [Mycena chlorophos]|uniref:Uncharacterized protein n=1 Tax=Mycena chlorophos TaxID=658473 RepID=A0A8H6WJL4_MYCCL|nr:hypothetical protein HMN09_00465300 [Mycena chlorophos]
MAKSKLSRKRSETMKKTLEAMGGKAKRGLDMVMSSPRKLMNQWSPRKRAKKNPEEEQTRFDDPFVIASEPVSPSSQPITRVKPVSTNSSRDPAGMLFTWNMNGHDGPVPDVAPKSPALWEAAARSSLFQAAAQSPARGLAFSSWQEQVADDDDCMSEATFEVHDEPEPLFPSTPTTSSPPRTSSPLPRSSSPDPRPPSPFPAEDDLFDEDDFPEDPDFQLDPENNLNEEEQAEFDAELQAGRSEPQDDYPRPAAPSEFLKASANAPEADGRKRRAPILADALAALKEASKARWIQRLGLGQFLSHARLCGIRALLSLYTDPESLTYNNWGDSMLQAAISMGRGKYCARSPPLLTRRYILDRSLLELNPYGRWNDSMLSDEDISDEVTAYLATLGDKISAEALRQFLSTPEFKERHGITREISHATACSFLRELGYRFRCPKSGQYVDGHEREDVVEYRNNVYLPEYFKLQDRVWVYGNDESEEPTCPHPNLGRRVILWYHDESIFYAHDRRRKTWVLQGRPAHAI